MIQLYNGDCLQVMDSLIEKGTKVDAIITDIPYGTTNCAWDSIIPFNEMWERLNKLIKDNGAIVLFGTEPFTSFLICSNVKRFREKLTWEKHKASNFGCAKYMHLKYSEDVVVFSNGKCTYNPQMIPRKSSRIREAQKGNSKQWLRTTKESKNVSFATEYEPKDWHCYNADWKYPSNVVKIPSVVSNSKERTEHPTQKPIKLMEYLIKTYTNENETVLDFTMGSGNTGVACCMCNRNFIGIELDKNYFKIAERRIKDEDAQGKLF